MRTHFHWSRVLPLVVILALAAAAFSPTMVQAEGDVPEVSPPPEAPLTQPETTAEIPVTTAVQVLAESGAELVGEDGAIPLASQSALTILCAPDPWFYGACDGGQCHYDQLNQALADWGVKKGYGMIYLEGNYNQDLSIFEEVFIDSGFPGYLTLKGITRDYGTDGDAPIIQGSIEVYEMPSGFTLQGLRILADAPDENALYFEYNKGMLKLIDLTITNTSGYGAEIYHAGSVEILRVDVSHNYLDGMTLDTCGWDVYWEDCPVSGTTKITDSTFSFNGNNENSMSLYIYTRNPIIINGFSAIGNKGDGLDIEAYGGAVTIKNAVLMNNSSLGGDPTWGYGLWVYEDSFSNFTLENVVATGNSEDGLYISTTGVVTIKSVTSYGNGKSGLRIAGDEGDLEPAARSVNVTNSNFFYNYHDNLLVSALGPITLSGVSINNSNDEGGAYLDNSQSLLPAPVTVTSSSFNGNQGAGLTVLSKGSITLNTITASGNNSYGVYLDNFTFMGATGGITMLATYGVNTIHSNGDDGLQINTTRNITLNKLTVSGSSEDGINVENAGPTSNLLLNDVSSWGNDGWGIAAEVGGTVTWNRGGAWDNGQDPLQEGGGAELRNYFSGLPKNITLKDVVFDGNLGDHGLSLETLGSITLTNISASGNTEGAGIHFEALEGQGGNFTILRTKPEGYNTINNNGLEGLYIFTRGNITLNRVQVNENVSQNAHLDTCQSLGVCKGVGAVMIKGTSSFPVQFNGRRSNEGLFIFAAGNITLSGIQVNQNAVDGLDATSINGSVSVLGMGNQFNHNGQDLTAQGGGVIIYAKGNITLMNFQAEENDGKGVLLDNTSGIGNITITATVPNFTNRVYNNTEQGMEIFSNGIVLVNKVNVAENDNGGLFIKNETASLPKPVSVISSTFIGNQNDDGLYISSKGAITINMVTAEWNGNQGAYIGNNYQAATALPITITKSTFNNNSDDGFRVNASGNIVLNTVTAMHNGVYGAYLRNYYSPGTGSVSVIGKNSFVDNDDHGLNIQSKGLVSVTGTDASFNQGFGIHIATEKAVTLSNTITLNNDWEGVDVGTKANVTISNLASFANGLTSPYSGSGLYILSDGGKVTIKNSSFIANNGYGFEVYVNNNPSLNVFMSLVNYMGNFGGTYLLGVIF